MSKIEVINLKGEKSKDLTLNKTVWDVEPNNVVLYDAIRLTRNSLRQGTHSTKNRSAVRGGGAKPWKQKGTGRARQGSIRSPQWRGGGVVFGPTPRDYSIKMNRKEKRLALKSALAYKKINSELVILTDFNIETNKTKDMVKVLEALNLTNEKVLLVVEEITENQIMATRNLSNINLLQFDEINTYDVLDSSKMVITEAALSKIEEVLA